MDNEDYYKTNDNQFTTGRLVIIYAQLQGICEFATSYNPFSARVTQSGAEMSNWTGRGC